MGRMQKVKGARFERELVNMAKAAGLDAERAWGSDGKALGESSESDLSLGGFRIQAKKRESYGNWLWKGLENVDAFVVGKNRKEPLIIMPYKEFLSMMRDVFLLEMLEGTKDGD